MKEYQVGDIVIFVDKDGHSHNALVIHVWSTSLNIAYADPWAEHDKFGAPIIKETSVPFRARENAQFKTEGIGSFYLSV
jgi:hypothetical protein